MMKLLVLASMLLVGCAAEVASTAPLGMCLDENGRVTLHITGSAEAIRPDLPTIIESWERFSEKPGSLTIDDIPSATCSIRFVAWDPKAPDAGDYFKSTGDISIDPEIITDGYVGMVVLHEIGHAFGMNHTIRGVMAPGSGAFFTSEDRKECLRVGACAPDTAWLPFDERHL